MQMYLLCAVWEYFTRFAFVVCMYKHHNVHGQCIQHSAAIGFFLLFSGKCKASFGWKKAFMPWWCLMSNIPADATDM